MVDVLSKFDRAHGGNEDAPKEGEGGGASFPSDGRPQIALVVPSVVRSGSEHDLLDTVAEAMELAARTDSRDFHRWLLTNPDWADEVSMDMADIASATGRRMAQAQATFESRASNAENSRGK